MIYLIEGNEPYLIEKKVNELIKGIEDVSKFNGDDKDFSIKEVNNALNTTSLFQDKNIVVLYNPNFLIKKESKEDKDLDSFIEYINHPNYDTDLIIYTYDNNFNKVLKAYKAISKNAEVINLSQLDPYNFKSAARSIITDSKISITKEAQEKLISMCNNSQSLLINNLEILRNYPEKIDEKCIDKLCVGEMDDDIFDLIDALSSNKVGNAIKILNTLYEHNNSVFMIVAVLASQLRFLYQVDYYKSKGYSKDEIANVTNSKPYRIEMSLKKLGKLDKYKIISLLSELSNIDVLNKSDSSLSQEERLELYIVKNFKAIKWKK